MLPREKPREHQIKLPKLTAAHAKTARVLRGTATKRVDLVELAGGRSKRDFPTRERLELTRARRR